MDQQRILMMFPEMDSEELYTLQALMKNMNSDQENTFLAIYKGRRRDRQLMVILCILGYFGVAGIHRLLMGDILLGVLYFFTVGLCFIGTTVDLVNINQLTLRYNTGQANQSAKMVWSISQGQ
jgi:TM2 domain-containing membrane protein YozV